MAFFKANPSLTKEPKFEEYSDKLRYVIDEDGKGRWIKPIPPLSTDYCEDIDY